MTRSRIPNAEFDLTIGLTNKFRQEETSGHGLVSAKNVDNAEVFLAGGQVHGSTVKSVQAQDGWESLNFFEGFDLDSNFQRKLVGVAGDTLYFVNSDNTLTLLSGTDYITADPTASGGLYPEAFKSVTSLDRLHLASPNNWPMKVDMAGQVSRWGVEAPGTRQVVVEPFEATSSGGFNGWTTAASTGGYWFTSDVTNAQFVTSTGSLTLVKNKTTTTDLTVQRILITEGDAGDISVPVSGDNQLYLGLYIPAGGLNSLPATGTCFSVKLPDSIVTDTYSTFNFDKGALQEGWQTLNLDLNNPDEQGTAGPFGTSGVSIVAEGYTLTTATAATTLSGVRLDHLYYYERGTPFVTTTGQQLLLGFENTTHTEVKPAGNRMDTTAFHTQGDYSLQVDKTQTSSAYLKVSYSGTTNLNFANSDAISFDVFIPEDTTGLMAASGISVRYGTKSGANFTNANEHRIDTTALTDGQWQTLTFDPTDPPTISGSGASLSAIQRFDVDFTFIKNSTKINGFKIDNLRKKFFDGYLNNTHSYKVTYLSRYGQESNAGPPSKFVTANAEQIWLQNLPVSEDPQVIARRIYRDHDSDAIYRQVTQINDNVTTSYVDNIPLASTSSRTPPLAGDAVNDNTPPPKFFDIAFWNASVFGINADNRFRLEISDPNEIESFPLVNGIEVDEELTALIPYSQGLLVISTDRVYILSGSNPTNYRLDIVNPEIGMAGRRAYTIAKGFPVGIHDEGPFLYSNPVEPWFIGAAAQKEWDAIPGECYQDAFVVHDKARFRIVFFLQTTSGGPYDKILVWSYGKRGTGSIGGEGSGVDALDTRTGAWYEIELPGSVRPKCAEIVELTDDQPLLYIGGDDGYVYQLQNESTSTWATGPTTTAVRMEVETADIPLSPPARDGRGRPRFIGLNVDLPTSNGTDGTGLELSVITRDDANGDVICSGTWYTTVSGLHDNRMVPVPGNLWGYWGRVKVVHSGSGHRPILKSVRLYTIPHSYLSGPA